MKHKLLLTTISIILALQTMLIGTVSFAAKPEITVMLDGKTLDFDVPAQIINDRTMVPMRAIFEAFGATVNWDSETSEVSAYTPGILLQMPLNSHEIYINTIELTIDLPAQIVNNRTLVPLRVVSECLGADVSWDGASKTVYINSTDNIQSINWNDNYIYYGEVLDGNASGYGMLLAKSDNTVVQLGKYSNSKILEGTDYFDNGECFTGTYSEGKRSFGTYYYNDGKYYTGEFKNSVFNGHGVMYYSNGDYLDVYWENDLPNGQGTFYHAADNIFMSGTYIDGKREGMFTLYDPYSNITITKEFKNDQLYDNSAKIAELQAEYAELDDWYRTEMEKLYDYIQNGDPYSTDWGKSIKESFYKSYGVTSSNSSPVNSNLDSFAVANAMRQQAALKAKADEAIYKAIMEYNETYIENWKTLINDSYNQQKKILDSKYNTLLNSY